jgi:NAD(P)-dependent dehydrogenase (short-subunit alcohol dehydrogenase family)
MSDVKGKTAIVTGGSKGYGYGIAEALKSAGADVWITSRHRDELQGAAEQLGVNFFTADATAAEDWDGLIKGVTDRSATVDILINNAGGGIKKAPLIEQTDDEIERSIALNLTAAILGSRRVVPIMKKQRSGTIINVSSVCAREAWPGWSVYSAAKVGLSLFSQCLYLEVQDFGVRVTTLIPSWGETDFLASAGIPQRDPDTAKRVTKPGELGDLVVQICTLPEHLEIIDLTVVPTVQKISPL